MSTNNMNKQTLKSKTKDELIQMILKQEILEKSNNELIQGLLKENIKSQQKQKPTPAPRKNVKQMVQEYEDNIIQPPLEFRDDYKPVPLPRTKKPVPLPRTKKPVPLPRTNITQLNQALKGFTKSFEISIINNKDPLTQLQNTRKAVEYHIIKILSSMKGLKFIETLEVTFKKIVNNEIVYKTAYFNSKPQTIINNTEIPEALQLSQQQILNIIARWISEGSGWTIESVYNHHLNIVQYQPMKGSSYIKLPQELRNSSKGLINMKNEDNECFRWCHIRHLNPQDKNPQRIKKSDKQYIQDLNYIEIEFPVLDSFQFMSSGLEKLVSNLPKKSLKYTSQKFKGKKLDLMARKGVYPYDYMDSFDKFSEKLPAKEEFYSVLNNEHISDEDYKHTQNVWNTFSLKNMGEYHNLYLKSDVLLLADVFENFRKTCLEYYKLDPCHYFTSPGLSWDAMLKMTKIKLELMTDIDMFQFIEKGLRGGISYIANRYGKANNKYMKEYNEKVPSKYIMYLDANNLYGWAMSQYLPTGGFRWMTQKQIDKIDLAKYKEDNNKGFIAEVDFEYPQELHDLHNDYPLAPEKINVDKYNLSEYCKRISEKYGISTGLVSKLIPTLGKKEKYVLHYRNLQLYIDLDLKVTNVHRVLEFNQSPWLKQYIDFNTEKRKNAKNAFEKDFFKLMNNSVFGKTMENIRKRVDVRLVTDDNKLLKYASKPTYVSSKIFNENLVAVHKIKETLTLNRPAYLGMCILDLSKTLMYDFHYNYIKNKYGEKAKLLFTDTDSLTYEIEAEDVYQDFWDDKNKFDNSDYPESSPYFDKTNKKVIGKFKDEAAGVPICEFVGLRSKMYSYIKDNQKGGKTAKGIKKNVIKKDIQHENYKETLFNNKQMYHKMKTIRSESHQLGSYEINKVSLSCFDDKRYILDDGKTSYAYGHKDINLVYQ